MARKEKKKKIIVIIAQDDFFNVRNQTNVYAFLKYTLRGK